MKLVSTQKNDKLQFHLLRGDSEGYITLWTVPDINSEEITKMQSSQSPIKSKLIHFFF